MKDRYGREIRYLRLSVTERCNLRCRYCMPENGICKKAREEMLTEDEMILAVEAAASLGFQKLRITGGEPMVRRNLLSVCRRASRVSGIEEVCLTTNATMLADPAGGTGRTMAAALREAGVSRVNISLDTLDPRRYAWITRRGSLKDALAGIEAALDTGFEKVKLNCVLIGSFNEDEVPALAQLTLKWPVDMRFIEMMPMPGTAGFGPEAFIPCSRVLEALPDLVPVREAREGVARLYRLPDAIGRVGMISPMEDHFCGACDRLRLTADGKLRPCLHSAAEYSVKGLDAAGMKARIEAAVLAKPARHGDLDWNNPSGARRRMNQIGG